MREQPDFIGRRYEEKEKDNLRGTLQQWSEESLRPLEGEREKTREEIQMIDAVNEMLQDELRSLGIEEYEPIPSEKVHILSGDVFEKHFPNCDDGALFFATKDAVFVNTDRPDNQARMLAMLLHELIHRASTIKFYADTDKDIYPSRVGYRIHSPWKDADRESRLRGFNELVTDYTLYKVLLKNKQMLADRFDITEEDIQGPIYTYMQYGPIMEAISRKIAERKGLSPLAVFNDFEKGLFAPNILVLKNIERAFGKGALEILSLLGTLDEESDNDQLAKIIEEFFAQENENERRIIQTTIKNFVAQTRKTKSRNP